MIYYAGDFPTGKTIYIPFTTNLATGARADASSAFEAADFLIYKDGSTTERTSSNGVTITSTFDTKTGVHMLAIDTSDNSDAGFYAAGHDYHVLLYPDETVDSVNISDWVGAFSIDNRGLLRPATAGRTLVVDGNGLADATTVKVGPSGSGTAQTAGDIIGDTNDIQSRLPAALVSGRMDSSVGAMASGVVTAAAVADGAIDRATFAADTGLQTVRSNTAAAGGATSITLDGSASATNDYYKHCLIYITGNTGVGQARFCTGYNGGTKVATVTPAWATNPDNTSTFAIIPLGSVNVQGWNGAAIATPDTAGYPVSTIKDGTGQGELDTASGKVLIQGTIDQLDDFVDATGKVLLQGTQTFNNTGTWTGDVTGNLSGSVGSVTGAVGSVTGNVGGNVTGSIGSLGATAKSDVNAEVVDCLNVDTYAEPGQEAPAATNTLSKKIGYLFKFLRNKITQDATTLKVFNDDAVTVDHKATVSDDGTTYTRGEIASGP